jgi:hypothetical protein
MELCHAHITCMGCAHDIYRIPRALGQAPQHAARLWTARAARIVTHCGQIAGLMSAHDAVFRVLGSSVDPDQFMHASSVTHRSGYTVQMER